MVEYIWVAGGNFLDVTIVPFGEHDPEEFWYRDERGETVPWLLVKTGEQLENIPPKTRVAVICREAVHERLWDISWHQYVDVVLYIHRNDVSMIPAGPVTDSTRYRLRDLSASHHEPLP